ncbi:hypothetical protein [Microbacterium radiodurans]|uniref:Uncharacterized protein n=1 Tax=Microbacterium radiodurans TaxID=661398 RepID=A0A5J5IVL9_9MICO|nr:hypothetical protein [Microbacterium radiodurans]KAA9089296.1 hypothetical protein F6B42_02070 [Microbacterium radiodurans]
MTNDRGRRLIERAGARLEPHHPPFMSSHPTALGWLWMAAVVAILVVCDIAGGPGWLRAVLTLSAALPPLAATLVVLSQTPRSHLEYEPSILTHFFARFLALFSAFVFWLGSVVIGGAIAVQLTDESGTDVATAWGAAIEIFAMIVPPVTVLLYCVLIIRYAGYLVRLRGWPAVPTRHRIPEHLLAEAPRTRRVVIGLAHPGLLLAAGLLSTLVALALTIRAEALLS